MASLGLSAAVNLRPSYESHLPDGPDVVAYQDGLLGGSDSAMEGKWGVVFGSDLLPNDHGVAGTNGLLNYRVSLPAQGETALKFPVVGEHQDGIVAHFEPVTLSVLSSIHPNRTVGIGVGSEYGGVHRRFGVNSDTAPPLSPLLRTMP